ncbi:Vacuolar protein sorting-associated protein [Lachnellula occidentalis]|uniref:Vacuolar protein sorting-associated protein 29 n=1 Tax=Lachnellula occidentalis TaxID=215460 RepID=A0A8H8RNB1_9HELO|nr:Vacuolar protein sorting-associated protein [Lachnellula occidentalis]
MTSRLVLFKKLLTPGKIGQTLCLGNLTDKPTYDYLRSISPDLKIVKGRFDADATSLPLAQTVTHGSLKIGFLEGFTMVAPMEMDLMLAEANKMDVDVLCWGGTHRFDAFEYENKFFCESGKCDRGVYNRVDGGWGGDGSELLLDGCESAKVKIEIEVQGIGLTLYVYQLRKDANGVESVNVEKITYTKNVGGS